MEAVRTVWGRSSATPGRRGPVRSGAPSPGTYGQCVRSSRSNTRYPTAVVSHRRSARWISHLSIAQRACLRARSTFHHQLPVSLAPSAVKKHAAASGSHSGEVELPISHHNNAADGRSPARRLRCRIFSPARRTARHNGAEALPLTSRRPPRRGHLDQVTHGTGRGEHPEDMEFGIGEHAAGSTLAPKRGPPHQHQRRAMADAVV